MLLWSGNVTSLVGFYGVRIAYPLLVLGVTGSPAAAGWVGFAVSLPSLLFMVPAGVIVDRCDKIRIIAICQVVGLAGTGTAIIAGLFRIPCGTVILDIAAFAEGTAYVFIGIGEVAAVRDVVAAEQYPAAYSFVQAEQPIAILIGRAVAAALYGVARWLPFAANAVSYLYCLMAVSMIEARQRPSAPAAGFGLESIRRELADGVRAVWREPLLRRTAAGAAVSNAVIQGVLLLILVELRTGGYPSWTSGVVLASAGVGGLGGAVLATRLTRRLPARQVYRGALWAWVALIAPIALSDNPFVLAVCWCGIGGVGVATNVALAVYQIEVVPEAVFGRAVATSALVSQAGLALGALGAGYLLAALGATATAWVMVAAMALLALVVGRPGPTGRAEAHVAKDSGSEAGFGSERTGA